MAGTDPINSKCTIVWGTNPDVTWPGMYWDILANMEKGGKLIVVDPRKTELAAKADVWIQLRPGTDCALALSMLNVIINEGLYDKEFTENYTYGFEELKDHVQEFTPEEAEKITWVPAEKIKEAARLYAQTSPASVCLGAAGVVGFPNSFQANRAIACLIALTGNLDIAGGNIHYPTPFGARSTMTGMMDAAFPNLLSKKQKAKRLGQDQLPVTNASGFIFAHPNAVFKAMIEGKPYPVKALMSFGGNLVTTSENAQVAREALMNLDFFSISTITMNPTADLADIILPAAHWAERDEIADFYTKDYGYAIPKIVEPLGECRDDKEIILEIAKRLGVEDMWETIEDYFDFRLESTGLTWKEFKEKKVLKRETKLQKYKEFGKFKTSSKKVDLYSNFLKLLGLEPLPTYVEPPEGPVSSPELFKEYPIILTSGTKHIDYVHSDHRHIKRLRERSPYPEVEIHPDTAGKYGIEDGDWVDIATPKGKIKQKAMFSDGILPGVISTPHGWWYGYKDGWKEVSINWITQDHDRGPEVGSTPVKSLLCKISKAVGPPETC